MAHRVRCRRGNVCLLKKWRLYIAGALIVALFAVFISPGPLQEWLFSGMGSVKPGCKTCEGQPIYCVQDDDCPKVVEETFYGDKVTLYLPKCENGECGYNAASKFPSGSVVCNFINCVTLTCADECDWDGCQGDYRCYDSDSDLCKEKVWSDACGIANPKYKGLQGTIKDMRILGENNIRAGEKINVQVDFQADVEGYYMLGVGIVYPEGPLFAVSPKYITRNYCEPSKYWRREIIFCR